MIPQRIVLAAIVAVGLAGSAVGQNFSPTTPPPGSAAPTPPARPATPIPPSTAGQQTELF